MNESTAAIEVHGLKKRFKKVDILRDVSFVVERGTIFALLGPNGAGKTTAINILTTLLPADELADQIALLHKGTIVAHGTAAELKALVPSGLVELTFEDERQRKSAASLLQTHYAVEAGDDLKLTVGVGEGTAKLAELFVRLRDARLEPVDFSQKLPTLDDVFFKFTGSTNETKENQ